MTSQCSTKNSNKIVVIGENKRYARITNESQIEVEVVKVDGCELVNSTACDYAIFHEKRGALIEFKGTDVEHGIEQLMAAWRHFRASREVDHYCGFIVSTRVPGASPSTQRKLEAAFRASRMKIRMKSQELRCGLEELLSK